MDSATRMYLGRAVLRKSRTIEEVASEFDVTPAAVRGWVRQARKLAQAESDAGTVKALEKKGAQKRPKKKQAPVPDPVQDSTPTKPTPEPKKQQEDKGLWPF